MIKSISVQRITSNNYVKFTWTAEGNLRIKVPVDDTDEIENKYIEIGYMVVTKLGPVDRTFRGKIEIGKSTILTMYNDSKTISKTVSI